METEHLIEFLTSAGKGKELTDFPLERNNLRDADFNSCWKVFAVTEGLT